MRKALDWKFYDRCNEDHSMHDPDIRDLQTLKEVVVPGVDHYNELSGDRKKGLRYKSVYRMWLDMMCEASGFAPQLLNPNDYDVYLSHPLPPHYPKLSQFDRQLSESGYVKSSKLLMPHLDKGGIQDHLRVTSIMNKAKCDAYEARIIADQCISLDATPVMVDEFCRWARVKGSDKLIEYLTPFMEVVVDESIPKQDEEPWENDPVAAGELLGYTEQDPMNIIRGSFGICKDTVIETIEPVKREAGIAKIIGDEIVWPETYEIEDEEAWEAQAAEWEPEDRNPNSGGIMSYHIVEDFSSSNEEEPWLKRQPKWFKASLLKLTSFEDLKPLMAWSRVIHRDQGFAGRKFNRDQSGVFWSEYHNYKTKLTPNFLSIACRAILERIVKANGQLKVFGQWMYKAQKGDIKLKNPPSEYEWGVIWKTYNRRKEVQAKA